MDSLNAILYSKGNHLTLGLEKEVNLSKVRFKPYKAYSTSLPDEIPPFHHLVYTPFMANVIIILKHVLLIIFKIYPESNCLLP